MNGQDEMNECMCGMNGSQVIHRAGIIKENLYGMVLKILLFRGATDMEREKKNRISSSISSSIPLLPSPPPPLPRVSAWDQLWSRIGEMR